MDAVVSLWYICVVFSFRSDLYRVFVSFWGFYIILPDFRDFKEKYTHTSMVKGNMHGTFLPFPGPIPNPEKMSLILSLCLRKVADPKCFQQEKSSNELYQVSITYIISIYPTTTSTPILYVSFLHPLYI